jgi:hypothetical protein
MPPERKVLKLSGQNRVIPINRETGEAEYEHPEEGEVNTDYGFVGSLVRTYPRVSQEEAVELFRTIQQMLGGDPEVARQYLNDRMARWFVDGLTFIVDPKQGKSGDIEGMLERSKEDRNTKFFWQKFVKFHPYESVKSKAANLVERLLSEQAIPNGSMVMFDSNGKGHDEFGSDIARHNGEVFKVLSLELDYPGSNNKENEYYTLELNGKKVYHAISGTHLTPVALPPTRPMDTRR